MPKKKQLVCKTCKRKLVEITTVIKGEKVIRHAHKKREHWQSPKPHATIPITEEELQALEASSLDHTAS